MHVIVLRRDGAKKLLISRLEDGASARRTFICGAEDLSWSREDGVPGLYVATLT